MLWRGTVTVIVWLLGLTCQLTDGQAFRNAITLLTAALIGCAPWVPLVFSIAGTRGRNAAVVIVFVSLIIIALLAIDLPEAYEFQRRFNERHPMQLNGLADS